MTLTGHLTFLSLCIHTCGHTHGTGRIRVQLEIHRNAFGKLRPPYLLRSRVLWDWRGKNFLGFLGGREGAGAESLSEHPSSYSPRGHLLEAVVGEGPLPCCLTPESCGKTTCWGWGRHQGTFSHTHTHTFTKGKGISFIPSTATNPPQASQHLRAPHFLDWGQI